MRRRKVQGEHGEKHAIRQIQRKQMHAENINLGMRPGMKVTWHGRESKMRSIELVTSDRMNRKGIHKKQRDADIKATRNTCRHKGSENLAYGTGRQKERSGYD